MTDDRYKHLYEAVSAWAEQTNWGSLHHEAQIKALVQSDPPLDRSSEAYMTRSLSAPVTARFFTNHSKSPAWLKWIEEKGLLKPLFGSAALPDEVGRLLAYWFADKFVCAHAEAALGLIQRAGLPLGESLWIAIGSALHPKRCAEASVVEKWIPILIRDAPPKDHRQSDLEYLLVGKEFKLSKSSTILILEFLLQPVPSLRPRFILGEEGEGPSIEVDFEIDLQGDDYWLGEIWQNLIKPNLSDFILELAPIVTSALTRCHYLLRSSGRATSHWDPTNYQRVAIEDQSIGGAPRHRTDILIDAARDIVENLLETNVALATSLISDWFKSDSPLLRRLAVHAQAQREDISPDEKLDFLLENDLLYAEHLRHEVFRTLRLSYPAAQEEARNQVLDAADRGPQGEHAERLREDVLDYVKYNLLVWLNQIAPEHAKTRQLLDAVVEIHPDYEPRENPDLSWAITVGPHEVESPITLEELQDLDPQTDLSPLVEAVRQADDYFEKGALLGAISAVVRRNFSWSISIAEALRQANEWETDLWSALTAGWATSEHSSEDWDRLLEILGSHQNLARLADPLAEMLVSIARSSIPTFGLNQFEKAEDLADKVWASLETAPQGSVSETPHDWLSDAINHAGGRLAEFSIRRIDAKRKLADVDAITQDDQARLSRICEGSTHHALLGLVVITQDLLFLYSLDHIWTKENLLPVFDWAANATKAEAAWAGYLWSPRWHRKILPDLLPAIQETFDYLDRLGKEHRRQLAAVVAGISIHAIDDPMSRPEWLRKYLAVGESHDRIALAHALSSALENLDDEAVRDIWDRWLREYVTERVGDIPVIADAEELRALYDLVMPLKVVLPELVPILITRAAVDMKFSRLYDRMAETTFGSEESVFAAELLEHVLASAQTPFFDCREAGQVVTSLHGTGAPHEVLTRICNRMAELGCGEAGTLLASIGGT